MKMILVICLLSCFIWPPDGLSDYDKMVLESGLIVYKDGSTKYPHDDYWDIYSDENHLENLKKELSKIAIKIKWLENEIDYMSTQQDREAVKTRELMCYDLGRSIKRMTILKLNIRYFEHLNSNLCQN